MPQTNQILVKRKIMKMIDALPKVSIVIPCYNCEKWIEKCLTAIEVQTYKGLIEVVCVDDCSTDDTLSVINRYVAVSRNSIQLISNATNLGPANSRNKAIKMSTGEWVAFCDSDDWYDKYFLEKMIMKALDDQSEIVICSYRKVLESNGQEIEVDYLAALPEKYSIEELLVSSKSSLCLMVIKKDILNDISIPDLRNGEDIAIVPVIESKAKKISIVREHLYNYLIRASSVSNTVSINVLYSLCKAYEYIYDNLGNEYKTEKELLGIRTVLYGATLSAFKVGGYNKEIKEQIDAFEKKFPLWRRNKYLSSFSNIKRLYIFFVGKRYFRFCRLYALLHKRLSV